MIHFLQIIGQCGLQRWLVKPDVALDPFEILLGPGLQALRPSPVTQQKLAQPVSRLQLVFLGRFPGSHQIAQGLVGCIGHPDRGEFTRTVAASQLLRIARSVFTRSPALVGIRLGAITSQRNSELCELPIQHIPGRPGLIAGPEMLDRSELVNQFANRFQGGSGWLRGNELLHLFLPPRRQSYRHGHQDLQIVSWTLRPTPFVCGSAPLVFIYSQRNPRSLRIGGCLSQGVAARQ